MYTPESIVVLRISVENWETLQSRIVAHQKDLQTSVGSEVAFRQRHELVVANVEIRQLFEVAEGVLVDLPQTVVLHVELIEVRQSHKVVLSDHLDPIGRDVECCQLGSLDGRQSLEVVVGDPQSLQTLLLKEIDGNLTQLIAG